VVKDWDIIIADRVESLYFLYLLQSIVNIDSQILTLRNRAIIGGVVSDSSLLSAPAEAVEAIHSVMPPVLFQGFSWASIYHVAS